MVLDYNSQSSLEKFEQHYIVSLAVDIWRAVLCLTLCIVTQKCLHIVAAHLFLERMNDLGLTPSR